MSVIACWLQGEAAHSIGHAGSSAECHGCSMDLTSADQGDQEPGVVLQCPKCKHLYCFDCDVYIHESLHNCPGCEGSTQSHGHDHIDDDVAMMSN